MTIAVVDYGAGNLSSVLKILRLFGETAEVAGTPEAIIMADRIILPGVGAAGPAMQRIRERELDKALSEAVHKNGRPMLCICLGMQLLATKLHEFGEHDGLGWIDGEVRHIADLQLDDSLRIPHMGWNQVEPTGQGSQSFGSSVLRREYYFAHSYTLRTNDATVIAAHSHYGTDLVAAVQFDNVIATQFHPEKSQVSGENLVLAFLDWAP